MPETTSTRAIGPSRFSGYRRIVAWEAEAFLRMLVAPLGAVKRGRKLPGVPFSREAVANAFVMLGLLPERRAEDILAEYRSHLEAEGFEIGVLTGELSVRPGAHRFQDAVAAGPPARPAAHAHAGVTTGSADPLWPTPAEAYLAALTSVASATIGTRGSTVELDTARIIAAVADALLQVGALPLNSALLSGGVSAAVQPVWRQHLAGLWARHARLGASSAEMGRSSLAVRLPMRARRGHDRGHYRAW